MSNAFNLFIDSVEPIIRLRKPDSETVVEIEPHLRRLILDRSWLEPSYYRPIPAKAYAQYLLYRPADREFSVVSFVWNPSQGSPVHDHCTWGVIGQYEGNEEETRFRLNENRLDSIGIVSVRPGDVSHVHPPNRDIHQIMNRTSTPTISIHIYGGDIGSQERRVYDPATAESRPFVSGYDPAV
jgi:3-mercaptopropionate dioxygenase